MKRTFASLITICSVLMLSSCATAPTADQLTRIKLLATIAAKDGTILTLQSNPQYKPAFELVYAELNSLVTTGNIVPTQLADILKQLPVKQLNGNGAALLLGDLPLLIDVLTSSNVDLSTKPRVLAAATGLRDGMGMALGH